MAEEIPERLVYDRQTCVIRGLCLERDQYLAWESGRKDCSWLGEPGEIDRDFGIPLLLPHERRGRDCARDLVVLVVDDPSIQDVVAVYRLHYSGQGWSAEHAIEQGK
ncbi:MAG: hypothetical protein ACRDJC_24525, partial [Thermomicrobiales bacterium]